MVKITVLTAAALAAGLVAGCGSPAPGVVTPHTSATPGVVAWVGHPAAPVPFVLQSPPYSTGTRPCRPADLSVSHGELGYATGNTNVEVSFTNHSATACWLDGYPTIAGVAADGTVSALPAEHGAARPFSLRPCPSYAEFLGGLMGPGAPRSHLVRYYYLNCGTVRAIPARGSVTYQMKLPLPSGLPAGVYAKLDWQIQGGIGPAAVTSVTVEPRT